MPHCRLQKMAENNMRRCLPGCTVCKIDCLLTKVQCYPVQASNTAIILKIPPAIIIGSTGVTLPDIKTCLFYFCNTFFVYLSVFALFRNFYVVFCNICPIILLVFQPGKDLTLAFLKHLWTFVHFYAIIRDIFSEFSKIRRIKL